MASFNKVILLGNLTRDPELKYTPKGTAAAQLGLAVNRVYTDSSGNKAEEVTFVDVVFFGRIAEIANEYLQKGKAAMIEGRLKLDTWDDKQTGQKRSKLRVIGETLQLLGNGGGQGAPRDAEEEAKAERTQVRRPTPPPAKPQDPDLDQPEDDIPF